MNKKQIETRIRNDKFIKEACKDSKIIRCPLCGKKMPQLCNSHSIPEFVLRNISGGDGYVDGLFNILDLCIQKEKFGVGQAGCFKMICTECDSKAFQTYETEDKLVNRDGESDILKEIALKNILKIMHGELEQRAIYYALYKRDGMPEHLYWMQVSSANLEMYFAEMLEIFDIPLEYEDSFQVLYNECFDYVTPIAAQGCFELKFDCLGNLIKIQHGIEKDYLRLLHIAVLPVKNKTVVLMFIHEKCKLEYEDFILQFTNLEEEEKIRFLNYIIFKCTDNFFISKKISKAVYTEAFLNICNPLSKGYREMGEVGVKNIAQEIQDCPNFLRMKLR